MELFELINNIRKRPTMYLGQTSIGQLRTFLAGYTFARRQLGITQTPQEKLFSTFQPWVAKRLALSPQQHWDQLILAASQSEEEALQSFFQLFDEFVASHNIEVRSMAQNSRTVTIL
ncbi:MAG: hypothetical protein F6K30_21445 [Cyanothece sp. SIO2G6]|nr:hypothetical protein [Cyanothece sp. SIO2G6]